ncbi:MAG: DUF3857 domain-containing protein [Flavobacteriaceae bacterium]
MRKLFIFFCLAYSINAVSQYKFNDQSHLVTRDDLITNEFVADSTAKALVIYEEGNSFFNESLSKLITDINRKVKIFDKNDSDLSTVEILLYKSDQRRDKEKIRNIKATTTSLVGNEIITTKIDKKDIFEEEYDDNYTIVKFTFPNVQDGSVLSYSYTLETPFIFNYHRWDFQEEIPKLYSEYRTSIPANYDYNVKLVGKANLAVNEAVIKYNCVEFGMGARADCTESKYVMKHIPAFIDEDYMTSSRNYLSSIQYELNTVKQFDGSVKKYTKTWKDADKELKSDKNIGKQLDKTSLVKNLLPNDIKIIEDKLEQAKKIYEFVQSNFAWNEEYRLFKEVSLNETIKTKTGRVSEINLLLFNLLKANEIEVKPVLLATRNVGIPTKLYPVISEFNYLVNQVEINGKSYLLDATDKYLSFGELPFRCLNYYGRLLDFKNGSSWIDIKPLENNTILHRLSLKFNEDDILTGTVNSKYQDHNSTTKKQAYFPNKKTYFEDFKNKNPNIDVIDHVVKTELKTDNVFEEELSIEYSDFNEAADKIFLDPFLIKFFKVNPFKLQERTYPIEFGYTNTFTYMAQFDLENRYEVVNLPEAFSIGLPDNSGSISFNPTAADNKLIVVLKISLYSAVYSPDLYDHLKQFFNKIIDTQSKTLIELKKI